MTLELTPDQVTRLALARYLLQNAETLIKNPQPFCSLALLSLHDAVEMVLDVVAEAANAPVSAGANFANYWNTLKSLADPVHLPLERQMNRLNRSRVALKHHGQWPNNDQLTTHLDTTKAFIEDVCDSVFATSLSEISLVELIKNEKVRELLRDAQQAIGRNNLRVAFTNAAHGMLYGLEAMPSFDFPASPLPRQTELRNLSPGTQDFDSLLRPLAKEIDDTFRATISRFRRTIALVSLGIDLSSYNKFEKLTPAVLFFRQEGSAERSGIAERAGWRVNGQIEDARWCIDFVTNFMLRVEGRERSY